MQQLPAASCFSYPGFSDNCLLPVQSERRCGMKKKPTNATINVRGTEITVIRREDEDYISLTDMLKAKDGDFFISDWLRNRNTVEFLGIWETVHNPDFNSGEFAIIKSQAGLNSYPPIAEIVQEMSVIAAKARETDKALRGILKQLGVSA
jgi:hypothetical protein